MLTFKSSGQGLAFKLARIISALFRDYVRVHSLRLCYGSKCSRGLLLKNFLPLKVRRLPASRALHEVVSAIDLHLFEDWLP